MSGLQATREETECAHRLAKLAHEYEEKIQKLESDLRVQKNYVKNDAKLEKAMAKKLDKTCAYICELRGRIEAYRKWLFEESEEINDGIISDRVAKYKFEEIFGKQIVPAEDSKTETEK